MYYIMSLVTYVLDNCAPIWKTNLNTENPAGNTTNLFWTFVVFNFLQNSVLHGKNIKNRAEMMNLHSKSQTPYLHRQFLKKHREGYYIFKGTSSIPAPRNEGEGDVL